MKPPPTAGPGSPANLPDLLANVPPFADMAELDAYMTACKRNPLPGLLDNTPAFHSLTEIDAWIESCKRPMVRDPGVLTEEEWQVGFASGRFRTSGRQRRP